MFLNRAQTEVSRTNEQIQDYCGKFNKMKSEQDDNEAKLLAELDDLTKTKQFLEEKLIELLRLVDLLLGTLTIKWEKIFFSLLNFTATEFKVIFIPTKLS